MKKTLPNSGEYQKNKKEEKGFSLRKLAKRLELLEPFIIDIVIDRRPSLTKKRLATLAEGLNLNEAD